MKCVAILSSTPDIVFFTGKPTRSRKALQTATVAPISH